LSPFWGQDRARLQDKARPQDRSRLEEGARRLDGVDPLLQERESFTSATAEHFRPKFGYKGALTESATQSGHSWWSAWCATGYAEVLAAQSDGSRLVALLGTICTGTTQFTSAAVAALRTFSSSLCGTTMAATLGSAAAVPFTGGRRRREEFSFSLV
jgi:hypothetical protein